ncbi:MAG: ABC transporter permease subunit [Gemmataceae bacterium]|nr:ABC transporter permease subunit [Gemmataceae bacterium]
MSLVQPITSWFRRRVLWSTSAESWHERRVHWTMLLAAVALGLLYGLRGIALWTRADGSTVKFPHTPDWLLLTLAGLWLVAAVVLMRLGQLKLFGPVLFYDMIRSARRSRYFMLRGFYSLVLLLVLFFVWMTVPHLNITARERASRLAMDYFEIFSIVQLVAVILLTPAYVAGAVSEEKDKKTLEFLLATDLHNREIVLSKLLSRFAHLGLFLITGLPILSLLQFLGGIDPNLVLAGFGFTALTMLGIGGISILNSVIYKRPRDSIAISYFYVIAYFFITLLLFQYHMPAVFRAGPGPAASGEEAFFEVLYTGNIVVLLAKVFRSGIAGTLSADLPGLLGEYALFYGGLALICIVWAIARVRRIALRQTFARQKLSQQAKDRPPVGELPMLWKEVHVEGSLRLNWMAWTLVSLLVIGSFANPFVWLVEWTVIGTQWQEGTMVRDMNLWTRITGAAVGCLTILGVSIRAANSIGGERDRQTMDDLLASPLESTEILAAKFVGALCSIRLGLIWLIGIYAIGMITGGLHLFAFPLLLAAWFVFASAAALIGLGYSMACHTTLRATVFTVLTCAGLGVGHWLAWFCCGPILFFSGSSGDGAMYLVKFQAGMTPPVVLFVLGFSGAELRADGVSRDMAELLAFSIFGLFLWTLAGLFFWNGVLVPRFRALTGRAEGTDAERWHVRRAPALSDNEKAGAAAAGTAAAEAAAAEAAPRDAIKETI